MSAANVVALVAIGFLSGAVLTAVLSPSTPSVFGVAAGILLQGGPGAQLLAGTSVVLVALFALGAARRAA